ncbi:MAG: hypothetical protein HC921_14015 [Synechococcaceae cyanobacterium SM2_3_1]|nr:hypothetical protein [Synechococcaceae cyanobacterium SM2_3_1]
MNTSLHYQKLGTTPTALSHLCRNAQLKELALFGSILHHDFRPDSGIDIMVTVDPNQKISLLEVEPFVRDALIRLNPKIAPNPDQ